MKRTEKILVDCLDDIESGKATVEECLERHPEIRGELEPMLGLAEKIKSLPAVTPSEAYKARARASLMAHIQSHPAKRPSGVSFLSIFSQPGWARAGIITLAVMVALAGAGTGSAYASQSSLPGDVLYPVKTGTEDFRAWIESDDAAGVSLQLEFADRRIEEMKRLVEKASPYIPVAVSGYEENIERALSEAEAVTSMIPMEDISLAAETQLNELDAIEDLNEGTPAADIAEAEQIAVNGQIRALSYLSDGEPVRASELTVEAMQNRLNRAASSASAGNTVRADGALRFFMQYAALGEGIQDEYEGTVTGANIDALYNQAAQTQERLFASFSGEVSPEIAERVRESFQMMERNRGQEPGNQPQVPGSEPEEPDNRQQGPADQPQGPGNQQEETDNQPQEPDNQRQEYGDQPQGPADQPQGPGNQDQGPGSQDEEAGNPGRESDVSGDSASAGQRGR